MSKSSHNTFYVTTPIYYVNAKPHIGTLYSTLLADVIARWERFSGKDVFFLTGTDEHGQKIAERAAKEDISPREFVDQMAPRFQEVWKEFDLSYNHFVRTTDEQHQRTVEKFIALLQEQGDIYKDTYEGLYCVPCETFVTPEQVATVEDKKCCPSCERELQHIAEENYFFRLSRYQDRLEAFYAANPGFIQPKERANEIKAFVAGGLKDLSISRKNVEWGIPFPGNSEHTVYVWVDALLNYISSLGFDKANSGDFEKYWPANVQVLAKDIIKFHAVYLPAIMMAAGFEPAHKLLVHGYILVNDAKMSKSKGNAYDPLELAADYGVDQVRYYLVRHMQTGHDGNFSLKDLATRIGSDLANNLGNLLQRTTSLALKYGAAHSQPPREWSEASTTLRAACAEMMAEFLQHMDNHDLSNAYSRLWKFVNSVNAYFHEQAPWKVAKDNQDAFREIISASCQSLYVIAHLVSPVMPYKAQQLLAALGHTNFISREELSENKWNTACSLLVPSEPLFIRPEIPEKVENQPAPPAPTKKVEKKASEPLPEGTITINDLIKVELVVGHIVECEPMPKSEKLLRMQVDMGSYGVRQVLAGLAKVFTQQDLVGKKAVFVANLAPRKMMGTVSHGMMLVAKSDDAYSLVTVSDEMSPGARLC